MAKARNRRPGRRTKTTGPREGVGELLELRLGDPAHGGACVARDDNGRVVFVRFGLPGELVRARVVDVRNQLAWADAVEVLEPSDDRMPSVWPEAGPGGVGGGELAHVKPAAQRRWKHDVLAQQIRRIGGESLAAAVDAIGGFTFEPAPGDEGADDLLLGRRTRIELTIGKDGRAGMHAYRSRDVIPLAEMPLAVPEIQALDLLGEDSPWAVHWKPGDRIRAVAPTGGDEAFVVTPRGTFNSLGEPVDPTRPLTWKTTWGGAEQSYDVAPGGFWQTHREGASVLAQAVDEMSGVTAGAAVMEFYSGAGLFTRVLAERAGESGHVVSLEGAESAVADADRNVGGDGAAGAAPVDLFAGNVDVEGVRDLRGELGATPDVVVLDPPRAGAAKGVMQAIADTGAPRVLLIACDPAAGARDMASLVNGAGYELREMQAWDLFPHTHHLEFAALMERR